GASGLLAGAAVRNPESAKTLVRASAPKPPPIRHSTSRRDRRVFRSECIVTSKPQQHFPIAYGCGAGFRSCQIHGRIGILPPTHTPTALTPSIDVQELIRGQQNLCVLLPPRQCPRGRRRQERLPEPQLALRRGPAVEQLERLLNPPGVIGGALLQ